MDALDQLKEAVRRLIDHGLGYRDIIEEVWTVYVEVKGLKEDRKHPQP